LSAQGTTAGRGFLAGLGSLPGLPITSPRGTGSHVGTLFSISVGILPGALGIWRTRYPDVPVRLVEFRRSTDLIAAMEAGQADVAVGPTPEGWAGPAREIGAEKFVVTATPGTVLPRRELVAGKGCDQQDTSAVASGPWVVATGSRSASPSTWGWLPSATAIAL